MSSIWIDILLGAVVAPWVIIGGSLRIAFKEKGLVGGLGSWLGMAMISTPVVMGVSWLGRTVLG